MIVRKVTCERKIRPVIWTIIALIALLLGGILSGAVLGGRCIIVSEAKAEDDWDIDEDDEDFDVDLWSGLDEDENPGDGEEWYGDIGGDDPYKQETSEPHVEADTTKQQNPETGYEVFLFDDANLLNADEEAKLLEEMYKTTTYGGAAFVSVSETTPHYGTSTKEYAEQFYLRYFGNNSGILFMIDMSTRELWISANGDIYKTVTDSYSNTIADNVYTYASDGNYYECARRVFYQANMLLEGRKISQPMKHVSNLLLAMVLAVVGVFGYILLISNKSKPSRSAVLGGTKQRHHFSNFAVTYLRTNSKYSPQSKSSGGGGGGRSGGGGGFSGGGGGHRF